MADHVEGSRPCIRARVERTSNPRCCACVVRLWGGLIAQRLAEPDDAKPNWVVPEMIGLKGISKTYRGKSVPCAALKGVDLEAENGEFVTVAGKLAYLTAAWVPQGGQALLAWIPAMDLANGCRA